MDNMEVKLKGKVSLLERRDLTKKGSLIHELFYGAVKGEKGVHVLCRRIEASHWERKVAPPRSRGNTVDG